MHSRERLGTCEPGARRLVPEPRRGVIALRELGAIERGFRSPSSSASSAPRRVAYARATGGGPMSAVAVSRGLVLAAASCGIVPDDHVAIDGDERRVRDARKRAVDALLGARSVPFGIGEPRALGVADRAKRREPRVVAGRLRELQHAVGARELPGANARAREIACEHRTKEAIGTLIERRDRGIADLERADELAAPDERGDLEHGGIGAAARLASEYLLGAVDVAEPEQRVDVEDRHDAFDRNAAGLLGGAGPRGPRVRELVALLVEMARRDLDGASCLELGNGGGAGSELDERRARGGELAAEDCELRQREHDACAHPHLRRRLRVRVGLRLRAGLPFALAFAFALADGFAFAFASALATTRRARRAHAARRPARPRECATPHAGGRRARPRRAMPARGARRG